MFRFTIRDVLLLTVVVALAVAWRLDRNSMRTEFAVQLRTAKLQQQKTERELASIQLLRKREERQREMIQLQKMELDLAANRKAWAASKAKSKELGAPQPKLPD